MLIMPFDFENMEYTFSTPKGTFVVGKSPDKRAKRIHLYLEQGVTRKSLGWFRDEKSAEMFLEVLD